MSKSPLSGVIQRSRWGSALYVFLGIELFVLVSSYWRYVLVTTTFGAINFYPPTSVSITIKEVIFGYVILAYILTDILAVMAVRYRHPRSLRLMWISFGGVVFLAIATISTAWMWQNMLFFAIFLLFSYGKILLVRQLFKNNSKRD